MKKDFITVSPDNGGRGTTQVSVVADPNSTFQSRSTTLNFSAGGGVSRAITVNQDGIPLMPVVGLTSLADNWNGTVTLSFNAIGFSTALAQNNDGYERVSYLSVKMNAQLPHVSETSDTYWVTRGALLLADSFEDVWPEPWNNGVFMETVYKDRPGGGTKIYYDIVKSDPERVGISGFTAHYLRMSDAKKFSPAYHVLQYIRFYLGDPERQGEFVCVAEFDFT